MKVGLFIDTFFPMIDGVVILVDNYARRLSKFCDVVVFAPSIPNSNFDDTTLPYKVIRCKSLSIFTLDYSLPIPKLDKNFIEILENEKLDLVHIHSPFAIGRIGINYAKKHNIPSISTIHSQFKQDFQKYIKLNSLSNLITKKIVKVFNSSTECWVVGGQLNAEFFYINYNLKKMPKYFPNSTDFETLNETEKNVSKKYVQKKHNIKDDENILLFVGRINLLKNILFIVDSISLLKNTDVKFKMLFVGNGNDEKILKEYIIQNNLDDDIILCGRISNRDELIKYYASAKIFLFPSKYDTSSIVQIEAASQYVPTIFIENSLTSGTITNNINGIISEDNPKDFANNIYKLLTDNKFYNFISSNAHKDIYVSWEQQIQNIYANYVRVIEEYNK